MKRLVLGLMLAAATASSAQVLDAKKISNSNGDVKSIDQMLSYGQKSLGPVKMSGAEINADLYKQIGIDLPTTWEAQTGVGKSVAKVEKVQAGDLVFFGDGNSKCVAFAGVAYKVNKVGFDFMYVTKDSVFTIANTNDAKFKNCFVSASHVVSDKDLNNAYKEWDNMVSDADKAKKNKEKSFNESKNAKKDIETARVALEKAKQRLADLEARKADNDKDVESSRTQWQQTMDAANQAASKGDTKKASKNLAKAQKQNEKASKKMSKYESQKDKLVKEIESAKKDVAKAEKNLEKAEKKAAKAADKYAEAQKEEIETAKKIAD